MSSRFVWANFSTVLIGGSGKLIAIKRTRMSGTIKIRLAFSFKRRTTGMEIPVGARMPCQASKSDLYPNSVMVGTLDSMGSWLGVNNKRLLEVLRHLIRDQPCKSVGWPF